MRKGVKIICILILIIVVLTLMILRLSPGRLSPLTGREGKVIEGSLVEKERIRIGGIEQGFFIRSENPDNPVILFLHGGPGSPELPLFENLEQHQRLEKYFTVCYWDQRGAGMSFSADLDPASATVPQFVEDTREMTEYLIKRFGKEKIYLMGHSWGSFLGVKVIEKYPQYYYAYMGIGQVTHQLLSEQLAYDYMLERATEAGDKDVVKNLSKFDKESPDFPSPAYLARYRTTYMNKYGIGITHEPYSMFSLLMDIMLFKGYTFSDKIGYVRGGMFSLQHVFYYVIEDNLFESSTRFDVPVYVLHGLYDYQVSYPLAKEWMNVIEAPNKSLYTFANSAHSPNMEEPEKFVSAVREIASLHN